MPTINDVDYLISYNGYAEDMRTYMAASRTTWTCKELWFPYGVNMLYGPNKKSRIQRICEMMRPYSAINYVDALLLPYDALLRVKELIALGGNPDIDDTIMMTPLMICCRNGWKGHIDMITILLDAGANINKKTIYGSSPLCLACFNGHLAITRELVRRGADIHYQDTAGYTPLHYAVTNGNLSIVNLLLEKGARFDSSVMLSAIKANKASMIKYLHKRGCPIPEYPLYSAIIGKHYDIIKTLIKIGVNPNEHVQGEDNTVLEEYLNNDAAVLALCQGGADVNVATNGTPLICHAMYTWGQNLKTLKILCKYKVNLNVQNINGDTPLHILVENRNKDDLVYMKELLKNPIDFTIVDNFGKTALDLAKEHELTDVVCEIKKAMLRKK